MVCLDSRSQSILMALTRANGHVSTAELAEGLGLTPRMVRYRLARLGAWLEERDAVLRRQPGEGLWVESTSEVRECILWDLCRLSGYELVLTPARRRELLIFLLLLADQPAVAKGLGRRLGVSRTTIFKDLDRVSVWFTSRELSLVRKPGLGIVVEGTERYRREALVGALFTQLGSEVLLFVCCGGEPKDIPFFLPSASVPPPGVLDFLASLQIAHGRRATAELESLIGAQFADSTYTRLVLNLALLITRIAQGKTIDYSEEPMESLADHPSFSAALEILGRLGRQLGLPVPEGEAAYLTTKLVDAEVVRRLQENPNKALHDTDVAPLVGRVVRRAAEWLGEPRLADDEQTTHELADHVEFVLQKGRFGSGMQSSLLDEVKAIYPGVYRVAKRVSEFLAEEIGQPIAEEETGSLAVYLRAALERLRSGPRYRVLVICPMGAATSQLLASRLAAEFPQLEVMDVLSVREFLARPLTKADAIISTVKSLPVQVHLPMIHVGPLLPKTDVLRVQTWMADRLQEEVDEAQQAQAGPRSTTSSSEAG